MLSALQRVRYLWGVAQQIVPLFLRWDAGRAATNSAGTRGCWDQKESDTASHSLTAAIPAQGRDSQLPPSSEHRGSQDSGSWAFHRCLFGQSMALGPVPALLAIPTLPAVPLCPCGGDLLPPATELPPCSFLLCLHLTKIFVLLFIMKEWIGENNTWTGQETAPIFIMNPRLILQSTEDHDFNGDGFFW